MGPNDQNQDRWQKLLARSRDAARYPIIAFVIFTSAIAAWLGCWGVWRAAEWVFHKYLAASWLK